MAFWFTSSCSILIWCWAVSCSALFLDRLAWMPLITPSPRSFWSVLAWSSAWLYWEFTAAAADFLSMMAELSVAWRLL